jgi:hypothetical protein
MSKEHDAPALARREPTISDADAKAIGKAARAELRDRFAGYALIGLLSGGECKYLKDEAVANRAWEQADAMLKARGHE